MKILLIQTPAKVMRYTYGPPLGLGYLASCAEKKGHTVKIVETNILNYKLRHIKKEIKNFNPDIVGISATTQHIREALTIAKISKKINPDCPTILGGTHPTFRSKELLEKNPYVDIIVRGEGEETFVELLENIGKKDLRGVKGISFKIDGKVIENENRKLIEDIDSIPFPAYHLFSMDKYRTTLRDMGIFGEPGQRYGAVLTSRGCPFNCIFCTNTLIGGKKWRGRSPENVIEEIKLLKDKYKCGVIEFLDSTFTIDKKRAIRICQLINEEGIDIKLLVQTRVDLFDEDIALALKKAGCVMILFGFESGVQKTLDYLNKGFKLEDSERAVKIAKAAGFHPAGFFIVGVPGETKIMVDKTIAFAKKLDLKYTGFTLFTPYPGTKVYDFAKENNLLLTEDWSKYHFFNLVMKIPGFSVRELKKIRKKADNECNYRLFQPEK